MTVSGDRGNELADIRARAEAHRDWTSAAGHEVGRQVAEDVLALLSRLGAGPAGYDRWGLRVKELEAQVEALTAQRDHAEALEIEVRAQLAEALSAEAQVEALVEALERIAKPPFPAEGGSYAGVMQAIAREALSRVSRSEPAPPNEHQGANSANYAEIRGRAKEAVRYGAEYGHRETNAAWCARIGADVLTLLALLDPAPPVPEEQQ